MQKHWLKKALGEKLLYKTKSKSYANLYILLRLKLPYWKHISRTLKNRSNVWKRKTKSLKANNFKQDYH